MLYVPTHKYVPTTHKYILELKLEQKNILYVPIPGDMNNLRLIFLMCILFCNMYFIFNVYFFFEIW